MEYQIVHGEDEDQLTAKVNEAIQNGWAPQGGVSVLINTFSKGHFGDDGTIEVWAPWSAEWHQAMIKHAGFSTLTDQDQQEAREALEKAILTRREVEKALDKELDKALGRVK